MWSNWSGHQTCDAPVLRPVGTAGVRSMMRQTAGSLRPVSTGHSFTPLVPGADTVVAPMPRYGPPVSAISGALARVDANAPLHALSKALDGSGRAFRNLGDINVQTLAGATSTATHGTGATLPCLSAEITAAQLVTADGEVVEVPSEDLPGVRVALGLLGILTEIEITTVPAYNLRRRVGVKPVADLMGTMQDKWADHRNYEFFVLPHSGKGVAIAHDLSTDPPGKAPMDLDELGMACLRGASALRHVSGGLRRAALNLLTAVQGNEDFVAESWKVLSSTRKTRFNEMEYHLPPDNADDVIGEILTLIETRHPDVWFPIEVRQTAGDTAWLSPFQHGARVSVAVHMHAKQRFEAFFADCEAIFRAAAGRPHWGKLHGLARTDLEALYPDLPKFDALRARMDPQGRFLSPALAALFAP